MRLAPKAIKPQTNFGACVGLGFVFSLIFISPRQLGPGKIKEIRIYIYSFSKIQEYLRL